MMIQNTEQIEVPYYTLTTKWEQKHMHDQLSAPLSDWPDWWAGCLRCLMKRKQIRRQTLLCNITGDLKSDNERDEAWWRLIIITSATTLQSLLSAPYLSHMWLSGLEQEKLLKIHVWADDLISIRKYSFV